MEISSSGLGLGLDAHIAAALDIMRLAVRRRRQRRDERSLAELLLGKGSSREAIFAYRHRLLGLLDDLDDLEELPSDLRLPELRAAWTREPHERLGRVVWKIPPLGPPRILIPSEQKDQTARFLEQYRRVANLGGPALVHRARIVLSQGTEQVDTEMSDDVEVSVAGLKALQEPEIPVLVTRMPPRFPTLQQVLVRAQSRPSW